jgi:hypothetical protein
MFITVRSIGDQLRVAVVSRIYRQIERNPFLFRNELSFILPFGIRGRSMIVRLQTDPTMNS